MFGNPVKQAFIRPYGSPIIIGDFRVTAAFGVIDADHPVPHEGTDIGNGKCYEPLLAMTTGVVTYSGGTKGIVRIKSDEYPDYEVAVAHASHILVGLGQRVTRGQQIATLDRVGTTACHGHLGCKKNGVEVDIWPLLDQNEEGDMLQGANPVPITNKKTWMKGDNTRFRSGPSIQADNILTEYAANVGFTPVYRVDGQAINGTTKWYAGFGGTPRGLELGYVHESVVAPLVDAVPVSSGFTQEQVNLKVAEAVTPYATRLTAIKSKAAIARARASEIVAINDDISND